MKFPIVLIILDGWGYSESKKENAIYLAKTPNYDEFLEKYPFTLLYAYGKYVGLPENQVGNSEAGHMNLGAGRVVIQDSVYISNTIKNGTFFKNPAFLEIINHSKCFHSKVHLIGILSSDQCPHMSPEHLVSLVKMLNQNGIFDVVIHFFTDGRDTLPNSALENWKNLKKNLYKGYRIGSVSGRLYLDRKKDWERTKKIYDLLTLGKTDFKSESLEKAIKQAYKRGETDEFISPTLINSNKNNLIQDGDSVIFFNLRSDRTRQLAKAFCQKEFKEFTREKILKNVKFVGLVNYGPDIDMIVAFPSYDIKNTLPAVLFRYRQLYIAEAEKYAHITYFFNGGYSDPVGGEHRIKVPSKKVDNYAKTPEMSAFEITKIVVESIKQNFYDFYAINFANADMLGHTGDLKAAIKGIEVIDKCIGKIFKSIKAKNGILIITADHGNAEYMGKYNTMHEKNPVPFIICDKKYKIKKEIGKLGDVAPTILEIIGLQRPKEMTGEILI